MSDSTLRELERAALERAGDLAVQAALAQAHVRQLGRDPRVDPRPRDEVARAAPSRAFPAREQIVSRWVTEVWPRALLQPLLYDRLLSPARPEEDAYQLPRGTLVLHIATWRTQSTDWGVEPIEWRITAQQPGCALWRECFVSSLPELGADVPDGVVGAISWDWTRGSPRGHHRTQWSTVKAWRTWARRGTVLAVGGAR
jgi:hypothetical protein